MNDDFPLEFYIQDCKTIVIVEKLEESIFNSVFMKSFLTILINFSL